MKLIKSKTKRREILELTMNTRIDQRHTPRISFCRPAILASDQKLINVMTQDISMCGVLIICSETIEADKNIEVIIRMSIDHEIIMNVKKIWSILIFTNNFYCWQMGNLITEISPSDQNLLASLIMDNLAEVSYPKLSFHNYSL
jgi:hypothetical protein